MVYLKLDGFEINGSFRRIRSKDCYYMWVFFLELFFGRFVVIVLDRKEKLIRKFMNNI